MAAVSFGAPSVATASGFDAPQVGGAQSGPVITDAAAIHYNPGQLGYLTGPELSLGAGVIVGGVSYQRDRRAQYQFEDNLDFAEPIDPADIDASKTGAARRVDAVPVGPTFDLFFAIPAIVDRFSVGLGIYIPYAAVLDFPRDGPQRFALQSISLASIHSTVGAGVKLHDVISVGAGITYGLSILELSKVQDFGAVDVFGDGLEREPIGQQNDFGADAPSTVRELDVLARQVDVEGAIGHSVSFNAGIALRPTDRLRLALVYQHGSRVRFRGDFRLDMNDDFFTQDLAAQGLQYPAVVTGDAEVTMRLPKRLTLGAGHAIHPRFSLDGFVTYAFYQEFDAVGISLSSPQLAQPALGIGETVDQGLVRDWMGSVIVEANGRIEATDKLRLSAMLGYHSPATPESTLDVASPDGHRLVGGVGMAYAFGPRFSLLADAEVQGLVPRRATDSDYDLGNGEYRLVLANIALHARFRFGDRKKRRGAKPSAPEVAPKAEPPKPDAAAPRTPPPDATEPSRESAPEPPPPAAAPEDADGPPPPPPPPPAP